MSPLCAFRLPAASPASGRKSAPLSRSSSPSSSPKTGTGGRKQGRLRLPQLGSRHRLSNSKENLEGSSKDGATNPEAEPREGAPQADTEGNGSGLLPPGSGDMVPPEMSTGTEASSSHCDVIMMNGESGQSNGLSTDCSTQGNMDPDNSLLQHRDNGCLEAMYNLYAISVSTAHYNELYYDGSCIIH